MSRYISTLSPWPLGTPLPANGLFVFYDPQQDDEFKVLPEQVAPEPEAPEPSTDVTGAQLLTLLQQGDGIGLVLLPSGKVLVSSTAAALPVVTAPRAPTAGQVDDTGDTFSFVPNPAYPSFAQYKVAGLPGVTGAVALDATNSYVQGGRIYVKVAGAVGIRGLALYVAGSGNVPDGAPLLNLEAFTGAVVETSTDILGNISTTKAYQVIAAYQAAGGPCIETDERYYGQEFTDDYTQPGDEFLYLCKPRRPLSAGQATVWKWGRYLEAGA